MKKFVFCLLSVLLLLSCNLTIFATTIDTNEISTPTSFSNTYVIYKDGTCDELKTVVTALMPRNGIMPLGTVTFKYEIQSWKNNLVRPVISASATGPDLMGAAGQCFVAPYFEEDINYKCDHAWAFTVGRDSVNVGSATSVLAGYQRMYLHTTIGLVAVPDANKTFYKKDFS